MTENLSQFREEFDRIIGQEAAKKTDANFSPERRDVLKIVSGLSALIALGIPSLAFAKKRRILEQFKPDMFFQLILREAK